MIEEFEYNAKWWLPDKPEEKIPGTLKYTPGKEVVLDLNGTFEYLRDIKERPIILGFSQQGKYITLYKCFGPLTSYHFPGYTKSSFYAIYVFIGAHFQKYEDIKFLKIYIRYPHLDEWVDVSGFNIEPDILHLFDDEEKEIKYKQPRSIQATIDNYKIFIDFKAYPKVSKQEVCIKQRTYIRVEFPAEISFAELLNITHRIQQFLSLGTMEAEYPLSIEGTTEANKTMRKDKPYYLPVEIFYSLPYTSKAPKELPPFDMLFTLKDISERFEFFLRNWFEKENLLEPVYDLFFGTLYSPSMYPEFQFLSLIQATESFHRRRYGGKYLVGETCLFSWDDVLEKDKEGLIEFLKDKLGIAWVKNAKIHKPSGSKTINISNGGNSAKIKISTNEREATLKISDGRTLHLNVKHENGKLNIYYEDYAKVRCVLENAIPDWIEKNMKKA